MINPQVPQEPEPKVPQEPEPIQAPAPTPPAISAEGEPQVPAEPREPVPYDRFHQVIEEKNDLKEKEITLNQRIMDQQMELDYYKERLQEWQRGQEVGEPPAPPPTLPPSLQGTSDGDLMTRMILEANPQLKPLFDLIAMKTKADLSKTEGEIRELKETLGRQEVQRKTEAESMRRNSVLDFSWKQAVEQVVPKDIQNDQEIAPRIAELALAKTRAAIERDPELSSLPEFLKTKKLGQIMRQALSEEVGFYKKPRNPSAPVQPRPVPIGAQPAATQVPGTGATPTANVLKDALASGMSAAQAMQVYFGQKNKT